MNKEQKEFAIFGAVVCAFAGIVLLAEGISGEAGKWAMIGGPAFIAFGIFRAVVLARKAVKNG